MMFESNRAWQEAVSAVSANRDVLMPVAGVFFLLPAVIAAFFLGDVQTQMLSQLGNPEALNKVMEGKFGLFMAIGLFSGLAQFVGAIAMLMLLTDRGRPTVGQAIGAAFSALPTMIGVMVLIWLGMVAAVLVMGVLSAALAMALPAGLATFLIAVLLMGGVFYLLVKLSLVTPVVAIEGVRNPITALSRSWNLTKGNSLRIFGFYVLLFLAYMVISMLIMMVIGGLLALAGTGTVVTFLSSVVSGAVGAVVAMVFTAVVAAIHRQLAGPSTEAISATFE